MKRIPIASAILFWCLAMSSEAAESVPSPYAGEESRVVKSLSAEDVAELRRGGGWGLARRRSSTACRGRSTCWSSRTRSRSLASRWPRLPRSMNECARRRLRKARISLPPSGHSTTRFATERSRRKAFGKMLAAIASSRARLRFVHLSAHLETPALLTHEQIARYDALRGYRSHAGGAAHGEHRSKEH